jgi:hypothetical protein
MNELSVIEERAIIEAARAHDGYEGATTLGVGHGETLVRYARTAAAAGHVTGAVKAVLEAAGEPVPDVPVKRSRLDARREAS